MNGNPFLGSRPWWVMTGVSVALAGLAGRAEAGAVIQEATPTGQYPASALFGLGQVTAPVTPPTAVLNAWADTAGQFFGGMSAWLCVYLAFSVVFIAGYYLLGWEVLGRPRLWRPHRSAGPWLLLGLVVVSLVQDGIALLAFLIWVGPHRHVPGGLAWLLHLVVIVKWAAAVALIVWMAFWVGSRDDVRLQFRRIGRALWEQRFSVAVVTLLGVLAISRGSDVLEQLPDVQRAWLTWPPSVEWVHLAAAVAVQALLAFLLVYLGRLRVQRAEVKYTDARDDREDPRFRCWLGIRWYWTWLLTPAALIAVMVILRFAELARVLWSRVLPILLVMWGIAIASSLIDRFKLVARLRFDPKLTPTDAPPAGAPAGDPVRRLARSQRQPAPPDPESVDATRTVGDLLAVAAVAVTGLGLVRSFTAPALVVGGGYSVASWIVVAMGVAVASGSWAVSNGLLRPWAKHLAEKKAKEHARGWHPIARMAYWASRGERPGRQSRWPTLSAVGPFLAADIILIFVPLWATHWLGVLATTVVAFGTLAVGLALLASSAQYRTPLPLFQLLRLKVTPVITLIAIVLVAGAELDKNSELHVIRGPAPSAQASAAAAPPGGTNLLASLQQWLADPATTSCAVQAPAGAAPGTREVRVEPLILVAAAGGGIRAAWWSAHVLGQLAATPCGRHAVFAVSSVSGSSVGLTVMATTRQPEVAMSRIAGPDALAAAIDGLLLRDMIAGTAGLNLIAAQMPSGRDFPDRAALMESAWETEEPALTEPFPLSHPVLPWRLLLNATAVRTGCRTIIADHPIGPAFPSAESSPDCVPGSAAPAADSYDLFAALDCLRGMDTATAALLGARFPYITPSGVVNGCARQSGQIEQYVDGGYADSSGLSTLADLAPTLMTAVRQYDTRAATSTPAGQPVTVVVPVTAYLGNSPQPEPVAGAVPASPPEPLIPLTSTASSAQSQLIGSTANLQRLAAETSASQLFSCTPGDSQCAQAQAAASAAVPDQLILAVPRKEPRVAAPLGWVLSQASRNALDAALRNEAMPSNACGLHLVNRPSRPYCPVGIGRLADLLRLVTSLSRHELAHLR